MKTHAVILFTILACAAGRALAASQTVNGITWTYTISNGSATVGNGTSAAVANNPVDLVVPTQLGGYTVKAIADNAFYTRSKILSVTIPISCESIGNMAFYGCYSMTNIVLGYGMKNVGTNAFRYCSALTNISIPNSVTNVCPGAFVGLTALQSITIGNGVSSLVGFSFGSDVTRVRLGNGIKEIGALTFNNCTKLSDCSIGNGVTNIGYKAFYNCQKLTHITLPEGLQSIEEQAFEGCVAATSLTIPNSVTFIGSSAFANCSFTSMYIGNGVTDLSPFSFFEQLSILSIGDGVTTIGSDVFQRCTRLSRLTIGNGVKTIGTDAFKNCSYLRTVSIGNSVRSLAPFAFSRHLRSISIGDSVNDITEDTFADCSGLEEINVSGNNTLYSSVDGVLLSKDGSTILLFPKCKTIDEYTIPTGVKSLQVEQFHDRLYVNSITIPSTVTNIGDRCFAGCSSETITIEEGVQQIGYQAFYQCQNLSSLRIPHSVKSIGYSSFYGCTNLKTLYLPRHFSESGISLTMLNIPSDCSIIFYDLSSILDVTGVTTVYDGTPKSVSAEASFLGGATAVLRYALSEDGPYSETNPLFTDAGTNTVWVVASAEGEDPITNSAQVVILPKALDASMACVVPDQVFDGTPKTPELHIRDGWPDILSTEDYTVRYEDNTAAGTARIVVEGRRNYAGTIEIPFDIDEPDDTRFLVVDLSRGTNAAAFPVSYLADVPAGGWTDEYKTTKLVLRKIPEGSFWMGSPEDELRRTENELRHRVTLSRGYYAGIFEVTQKQWELVMGTNVAQNPGDARPIEEVSYHMIRGSDAGTNFPASSAVDADSFLGVLRAKTGLDGFDLPTEAQSEYACRAGTDSAINSGKNLESDSGYSANMAEVGRYSGNQTDGRGYGQHTTVGSYFPNRWGLYDMHGNVFEWCRDRWGLQTSLNPVGSTDGKTYVVRCGCWKFPSNQARSAFRKPQGPADRYNDIGFRLVYESPEPAETVWYVDAERGDDENTGRSWADALRTIQNATDRSVAGNTVLVTNGVYEPFTAMNKGIVIRSVEGAAATIVDGGGTNRCATLGESTNDVVKTTLIGFTLRNGSATEAEANGGGSNGGVLKDCVIRENSCWPERSSATGVFGRGGGLCGSIANRCEIVGNHSGNDGGGAYLCILADCLVSGNSAANKGGYDAGGGMMYCRASRCTIVRNTVGEGTAFTETGGAGANSCVLDSCIVYENAYSTGEEGNAVACTATYSCFGSVVAGTGNIAADPKFVDAANGDFRLAADSPCIDAGNDASVRSATDLAGNERIFGRHVDMGAYENCDFFALVVNGVEVVYDGQPHQVVTTATCPGATAVLRYALAEDGPYSETNPSFTDAGTNTVWVVASAAGEDPITNSAQVIILPKALDASMFESVQDQVFDGAAKTPLIVPTANWCGILDVEDYAAQYENNIEVGVASIIVTGARNCSGQITIPFTILESADTVWFVDAENGSDENSGRSWADALRTIQSAVGRAVAGNTVLVTNGVYESFTTDGLGITIRSVEGPENTIVDGGGVSRCAFLGFNTNDVEMTTLVGFTLRNGRNMHGTGAFGGVVENCVITGNYAGKDNDPSFEGCGGGLFKSIARNCVISNNMAQAHGGGVDLCEVSHCIIVDNQARGNGAGARRSSVSDSLIARNVSLNDRGSASGGGARNCRLIRCTVAGNLAGPGGSSSPGQGGIDSCQSVENCIIYENKLTDGTDSNANGSTITYSCLGSSVSGTGNIVADPLFVDSANGNYRLAANSPCIDAGAAGDLDLSFDLDGNPRVKGRSIDMGCYEFQTVQTETTTTPVPVPFAWLDEYPEALAANGDDYETFGNATAANGADKVWQCYVSGVNPTNATERFLAQIAVTNGTADVWWTPDLNEGGTKSERVYTVEGKTNLVDRSWGPTNESTRFFRVKVEMP